MEDLEEDALIHDLGNLIRRCTGDSSLPDPSQVIRQSLAYKYVLSHHIIIAWNELQLHASRDHDN